MLAIMMIYPTLALKTKTDYIIKLRKVSKLGKDHRRRNMKRLFKSMRNLNNRITVCRREETINIQAPYQFKFNQNNEYRGQRTNNNQQ